MQRMRVRGVKLRAGEGLSGTIVVKPVLARLEACDDRVARGRVMLRCMLTWRTITAADMTAFGASAKVKPPSAQSQAFDATCSAWFGRRVDTVPLGFHGLFSDFRLVELLFIGGPTRGTPFDSLLMCSCRSAVSNARVALPNFYNIAIGIANVAARLAVLGLRLGDELRSSTSPKLITRLNICNADSHEAAD